MRSIVGDGLWSSASGLLLIPDRDKDNWVRASREGARAEEVAWTKLKGRERALEKAVRCYCDDITRLCDVVRQVFERLFDLFFGILVVFLQILCISVAAISSPFMHFDNFTKESKMY